MRNRSPAYLLIAAIGYATLAQGAFFGDQLLLFEVLAAFAILAARPRVRGAVPLSAAAVVASAALSAAVAGHPRNVVQQCLFVAVLAGVALAARRADREILATGLLVCGGIVAAAGWAGVAFRWTVFAIQNGELWRASSTITYANAAGAVCAMLALVALSREDRWVGFLLLIGLGATQSRGAAVGIIAGGAVLGLRVWLRSWPVAVGAAVAVTGLLPSSPASGPPRPFLALAGVAAGAAVVAFGRRALLVLVPAAAAGAIAGRGVTRVIAGARGFDISVADRIDRWGDFVELIRLRPFLGHGPGGFLLRYDDPVELDVGRYAHAEYLQIAAEQGLVGLAVVLASMGALLREYLAARNDDPLWRGGLAACVAFAVHGAVDFIWNVPVVPVVAAALYGAGSASERR